jgi:N-alpha-acetyltransferase 15/16, NatA auxiliary subunit
MHLQQVPSYDVEYSEVLLYHIRLLEDIGSFGQAISLLDESAKSRLIVDRVAIMEYRGAYSSPFALGGALTFGSITTSADFG